MLDKEESGRSTPTTLSSDAVEVLSDLVFNSDVEQNWSVIFTDDNNSMDHDLRSNYSSSEADDDIFQQMIRSTTSNDDKLEVKSVESFNIDEDTSVSTLKGDKFEQSIQMPNPIKDISLSDANNVESNLISIPVIVNDNENENSSLSWLKYYFIYGVLGLLVLDKILDVFGVDIFHFYASKRDVEPLRPDYQYQGDNSDILTITKYATTTQTLIIPAQTITVGSELPMESIYKAVESFPSNVSSWSLVKALYDNVASSIETTCEQGIEQLKNYTSKTALTAFKVDCTLKKNSELLLKRLNNLGTNYSRFIAGIWEKDIKDSNFVSKARLKSFNTWKSFLKGFEKIKNSEKSKMLNVLSNSVLNKMMQFRKDILNKDYASIFRINSEKVSSWAYKTKEQLLKLSSFDSNYLKKMSHVDEEPKKASYWSDCSKQIFKSHSMFFRLSTKKKSDESIFGKAENWAMKVSRNADLLVTRLLYDLMTH